jgi:hypothetical protein
MSNLIPPLLAFTVALAVSGLELITSSYPRTGYFIASCRQVYAYVLVYGLIAFSVTLGFDGLVEHGLLNLQGLGMSNAWLRAVALGVSVKALLHIRLFTVGVGDSKMPVGTETIVQMFEPWLLEQIELHEFNSIRAFLAPWETRYNEISAVRANILRNLPYTFSGSERVAFEVSLKKKSNSPTECMEMYLRRFGKKSFVRAFGD